MRKLLFTALALLSLTCAAAPLLAADPQDAAGSKDPPLFSRMPGFHIYRSEVMDFDRYEFRVGPDKNEAVEGRLSMAIYYANEGIRLPSALQIVRNYTNAASAIGGEKLYEYDDGGQLFVILKVVRNGAEFWAEVRGGGNGMYMVQVVEKQAMTQAVVATAEVMAVGIQETGKAAIYGIYFDTNKAVIKPESEPAMAEIIKLIKANPKQRLYVVGHTDNQGTFDANLKLSRDRAEAVVKALIAKGIAPGLLSAQGVGPLAPAASNASEAGRAKNRRVELVAW